MTDFTVAPSELDAASQAYGRLSTELQTLQAQHDAVVIADSAFGRIPWLPDEIRNAYREHHQACTDSLKGSVDAMNQLSEAMAACATAYRTTEQIAAARVMEIIDELGI